jgi:hypothetical protein
MKTIADEGTILKAERQTTPRVPAVTDILRGSNYALTIFTEAEIRSLVLYEKGGKLSMS